MGQNNNHGANTSDGGNDTNSGALNVDKETASKLFDESYKLLDRDKNGFVNREELQTAFSASNITYDRLPGPSISRPDVKNMASLRLTSQTEIDAAKNSEYFQTRIKGGMFLVAGAACTVAGAAAALAPEPAGDRT